MVPETSGKTRPVKVVLAGFYPPTPLPEGDYLEEIGRAVMTEGHEVTVIAPNDSPARAISPKVLPIGGDWGWSAMQAIADRIVEERPDVVALCYVLHLGKGSPASTMLPFLLRRAGYKGRFVTVFSNPIGFEKRRFPFSAGLLAIASHLMPRRQFDVGYGSLFSADRIICLSLQHAAHIRSRLRQNPERVVTFPPFSTLTFAPMTPESREEGRRKLGAKPGEIVVTNFGYIRPEKQIEMLIDAAALLRDVPLLRFVVAGAEDSTLPGYVQSLKDRVANVGLLERFHFTGPYPAESIDGSLWLHGSDLCVLPTSGGLALNNSSLAAALRHGLPTISMKGAVRGQASTDLDDPVIEKVTSVVPNDTDALAKEIRALAVDPFRRTEMRKVALLLSERLYSPTAMTTAITEFTRPVEGLRSDSLDDLFTERS